jgi:hypothetical protein
MVSIERALDDQLRSAIRTADQARLALAKVDLSRADRLSKPLYSADLSALWDRWRISLVELQLQLGPQPKE